MASHDFTISFNKPVQRSCDRQRRTGDERDAKFLRGRSATGYTAIFLACACLWNIPLDNQRQCRPGLFCVCHYQPHKRLAVAAADKPGSHAISIQRSSCDEFSATLLSCVVGTLKTPPALMRTA